MERAVLVYTTWPSIVVAEQAGRTIVERRLAACVNILPGMVSHPTVAKTKTKPVRPAQPEFQPVSVPTGHAVRAKLRYQ